MYALAHTDHADVTSLAWLQPSQDRSKRAPDSWPVELSRHADERRATPRALPRRTDTRTDSRARYDHDVETRARLGSKPVKRPTTMGIAEAAASV